MTDGNASFLRAARAGNLEKVIEWLKGNVDINTSNANGLNALHLASKEGHVNVVTELIKRGANVNAATKKGNASLHIASLAGQEEVVKILVQNGANVNVQSQNGFTPLYMAAQENHDNVLRFLLANGANQSLATEDGFTPLAVALQQGHDKVVALLLENDTKGKVRLPALHIAAKKDDCKAAALLLQSDHNPDVTSKSGFTPLHIAAHYGNDSIATLLLEKGADVNFAAKHQITPLHVAAKWGKANMVSLLIEKGANIAAATRDGLTPLHCAARSGHDSVVDQLLENGAPISAKTKNGLAPLHMSSQGDHVDSARILLYHKAPVDDITVDYLTALHVAAHCGHVNVAKLLLDRSADPNARALNGFTPLHIACKKNRIKVVELLLKHGASIEATTESGLTPLHVASFMGCMNIVIYLIQNGANPDVPTVRGETPLHLAARANQTDIIRILLRNGAHVDAAAREEQTPLHIAARLGNVDIVSLLLQHGAAVDATTKDLYTALHVAAKEGQEEVASVLLDHGASLTATTKKGLTPLHMAAKYGNIKVARLLLHKDAPVDAQGKNGVTPLHVAAHYDHVNVALLLLDKGASPHATAKNGYTPLHISAKKNQMDIATTLLEYGAKAGDESKAGFTSLHLAAQEGHTDMATLLIEHNADVNAKAKNGLTPLHLCAQEDKVNVAAILVKNGAEIDPQTKAGYTPLHVACHFGQINMVRFLLQHSADVNSTTSHGYTPLHQAAQQGHSLIINLLLENQASPNITSAQGQTPLSIAQRLGYISVVETLKVVTETVVTTTTTTVIEEKYKVVAPETMQETFMSDSEDEGGDDTMLGDQSYRYLTADEMKSLGDDSLPIDVTKDERATDSMILTKESAAPLTIEEDHLSPQHVQMMETSLNGSYSPDNIDISHAPIHAGFLVSFMVDARGGAMRGCRHSGVRVIIPPRKAPMPMRITCRYLRKEKLAHPPPLMEGEACASRILEMGPVAARFLGPVIIEVPHFASLRGKEREITILRCDNGETWREHALEASEEAVQEVLNESFEGEELSALEDLNTNRITRILTTDFPQYFAIITRIRQEVHAVGPEGGMVSSAVVPQVQAVFPEGALTKKIKVGLQAQPIQPDLVAKLLGNRVAVSPIVTVEPRRRKFHKPITLTIPVPQAATKGMINQYSGDAPTLRLLCSITGGPSKAQWEDVTGSTPLTFINECVSFTTTVSARFWLMDCRQVSEATKFATELYQEAIHVPFMGKFVIFAKRHEILEAQLRVFCMTDDKEDKTLESQEHFIEIAKSRDVEVLENKHQYLEFAGNLVPVTKSGDQLYLTFHAFRENRLPFSIRVKDPLQEPMGRIAFMKEPRAGKSEPQQTPICNLNIALPEICKMDIAELVTLERKYGFVQEIGLAKPELIHRADLRLSDIARELDKDWVALALQLDISEAEINSIKSDCPDDINQQALIMLRRWMQKAGPRATGNQLEKALRKINREDIPKHCMFNVELVTDDVEKAVAKVHLDQSGFETFKEELGPSRDASLKREASLDVSYDEQDLMKEAESTVETSSESEHIRKDTKEDDLSKETTLPFSKEKDSFMEPETSDRQCPDTVVKPPAEDFIQQVILYETEQSPSDHYNIEESTPDETINQEIDETRRKFPLLPCTQLDEHLQMKESTNDDIQKSQISLTADEKTALVDDHIRDTSFEMPLSALNTSDLEEEIPWLPDEMQANVSQSELPAVSPPWNQDIPRNISDESQIIEVLPSKEIEPTEWSDFMIHLGKEEEASEASPNEQTEKMAEILERHFEEIDKTTMMEKVIPDFVPLEMSLLGGTTVGNLRVTAFEPDHSFNEQQLNDEIKGISSIMQEEYVIQNQGADKIDLPEDQIIQPCASYSDKHHVDIQEFPSSTMRTQSDELEGYFENGIGNALSNFDNECLKQTQSRELIDKINKQHDEGESNKVAIPSEEILDISMENRMNNSCDGKLRKPKLEEKHPLEKKTPSPPSEVKEEVSTPVIPVPEEPKLPEDIKHATSATVESQEVLEDGTVKRTVTTVTTTTVVMDGEEASEQEMQDHTAKLAESETWASEMDTSQVSISSLPEDEKSEPTTATISSSTAAEPEPCAEETPTEDKEWSESDEKDVRQVSQTGSNNVAREDSQRPEGQEDRDARSFDSHFEPRPEHHDVSVTEKSRGEEIEKIQHTVTESKELSDKISLTVKEKEDAEKCDELSSTEVDKHDAPPPPQVVINGDSTETERLSFEGKFSDDAKPDVSSPSDEVLVEPVDVTEKQDIEPELESEVKPVVTTPVSERKHKPESKPRRSHIPVYDVTGKYEGPDVKHTEPIIIEPEDDKDSLVIDRHHSTPDFRQLAGSDLEAILEEHAKDEQLRAVSESAVSEDHFSPSLHKRKPSPPDVQPPKPSPSSVETFDSTAESEVSPTLKDSPKLVTKSFSESTSTAKMNVQYDSTEITVDSEQIKLTIESKDDSGTEIHKEVPESQDASTLVPDRTQMAFDNSAFVGVDMIDVADSIDRDMARSPYEVVRRDIEDFEIEGSNKLLTAVGSADTTELIKCSELPTREEATKLAHEIIEEIKTEVAKRPPLHQISSEISDEDLVEHDKPFGESSATDDMADLKITIPDRTFSDKESSFHTYKETKSVIYEEKTVTDKKESFQECEYQMTMREEIWETGTDVEKTAHSETIEESVSTVEDILSLEAIDKVHDHATTLQKKELEIEKELMSPCKQLPDSIESDVPYSTAHSAASPDESYGSSESDVKQQAVSDAVEADMHDSNISLWDRAQRYSGQYLQGELVDEISESVISQIQKSPTEHDSSVAGTIETTTYQINGPLEVEYVPEYDDEKYSLDKLIKHSFDTSTANDEGRKGQTGHAESTSEIEKPRVAQMEIDRFNVTETSRLASQPLPTVKITEIKDSYMHLTEEDFLQQRAPLFDDQADQEIKKILGDESQTEDDRVADIIERPLTPEPSEEMLMEENLLPESDQLSHQVSDSIEIGTDKHEITTKESASSDQDQRVGGIDTSSILSETASSDTVQDFSTKMSFQEDYPQEEAMDIGSDKCDDIDESEKPHSYEYGVHFASEPDYDEIPKYVESGYGDLYTHQEEDEDIFDDDMQESRVLVEDGKQIYPDLDNLLEPKFYTKSGEHDDSSMSSLQEFERFEAEIATGRKLSQGSVDSLNDHPPTSKSGEHDDVSMNSLTEFERLERECAEAERVENVACEEAARLSEIEEGHESQASEASHETLSGPEDMDSIDSDDYEKRLSEIDEIIRQAQCNVEKFQDDPVSLRAEHTKHSKKVALKIAKKEMVLAKPGLPASIGPDVLDGNLNRVDFPVQKSKDLDSLEEDGISMTGPRVDLPSTQDVDLDSLHEDHSRSVDHDSLHEARQEQEQDSLRDDKTGDLDSLQEEANIIMQDSLYEERDLDQDSLHESVELPKDELDSKIISNVTVSKGVEETEFEDSLHEELCTSGKGLEHEIHEICAKVDCMVSSTDSLEPSSSAATHATYHFDTDSIMSSSLNSVQASGEETLMASSTDSIDPERMSAVYANSTTVDYSIHESTYGSYLLDAEGNVQSMQGKTGTDKEGNINSSSEMIQRLQSAEKVFSMSSENVFTEKTSTVLPTEMKVMLGDSVSLPPKYTSKSVDEKSIASDLPTQHTPKVPGISDLQEVQHSVYENGNIDQEGNIIQQDLQLPQDTVFHGRSIKYIEPSKQQIDKVIEDEDSQQAVLIEQGIKDTPTTKPGEQVEEIRTTDEHGNIKIIRRTRRIVTVQRDSLSSPDSCKSDTSEPIEETRTVDEKGNIKVIRRIRRVVRLSDSQSSDVDKWHFQGILQSDDVQATSSDVSQTDSLQERIHCSSPAKLSDLQIGSQEVKSGRESVCSIRSDFSDTDSDIKEFKTTDEKGNIIIRRVRRIVTPIPSESNSRSSSPLCIEPSVEEKRIVDGKGNVIIRRVKRIIKVQQSDSSENEEFSRLGSSVLDDDLEKPEESQIIDEDGNVKIIQRIRKIVEAPQSPEISGAITSEEENSQQFLKLDSDVPNGMENSYDNTVLPEHSAFQSSDGEMFEEVRTVDERGNVKITRIRKKIVPHRKSTDEDDSSSVEERFREFLKSTSLSDCANEEEAKEERTVDEKGNVVIVRTIKRHTMSEPQVHSKSFFGPFAEQQSDEYVKTFDTLQSREDVSKYEATDDEGNVIRVTQEVRIEPHVKKLSFSGPDAQQKMEEYMRSYSQTSKQPSKFTSETISVPATNGNMLSSYDSSTDDPQSSLETIPPSGISYHHEVESNGIQPVSGTVLQMSKEQCRSQRTVQFEDFINQDVEPPSDGKDSTLDVGLQLDQSIPAVETRLTDEKKEDTDHLKLPH